MNGKRGIKRENRNGCECMEGLSEKRGRVSERGRIRERMIDGMGG